MSSESNREKRKRYKRKAREKKLDRKRGNKKGGSAAATPEPMFGLRSVL